MNDKDIKYDVEGILKALERGNLGDVLDIVVKNEGVSLKTSSMKGEIHRFSQEQKINRYSSEEMYEMRRRLRAEICEYLNRKIFKEK